MHWRIKGLIQKALGVMPGGEALHYHLQRRFGGLQDFHRELSVKVEDWQIMVRHLRDARVMQSGKKVAHPSIRGWVAQRQCLFRGVA